MIMVNGKKEVKIVFIGESGSGKSTLIRHLAKNPEMLKHASSESGTAGVTFVTVEYLFGDFDSVRLESVSCNIEEYTKNIGFVNYLEGLGKNDLDKQSDDYKSEMNELAKNYLISKPIRRLFLEDINSLEASRAFNTISICVPVNDELHNEMTKNDISRFKAVDTRGLGHKDDIVRFIPFAGADAIMIVGSTRQPNPSVLDGMIDVCRNYSHIPILFVGQHVINEEHVNVSLGDTIDTYLSKLNEYNKSSSIHIRNFYYNACKDYCNIIEPVRKIMDSSRINNIPETRWLRDSNVAIGYFKFYVPACIFAFTNCIKTISYYQNVQKDVADRLSNADITKIFNSLHTKDILESIIPITLPDPKTRPSNVDFRAIAQGFTKSKRPLSYSYNCVATTLREMMRSSIDEAVFDNNTDSNSILKFLVRRVLENNSYNWDWGTGYEYTALKNAFNIVMSCKNKLDKQNLKLNAVISTRFKKQYSGDESVRILLYEEALLNLLQKIRDDIVVNDFLMNYTSGNEEN